MGGVCLSCGNPLVGRQKKFCSLTCSNGNIEKIELVKKTNLARLGVDVPSKSASIREKMAKTSRERYGANTSWHAASSARVSRRLLIDDEVDDLVKAGMTTREIATATGASRDTVVRRLNEHGVSFKAANRKSTSNPQREVSRFISSLGFEVHDGKTGILSGRHEIDVYVDALKFGIELDGMYWHSNGNRETDSKNRLNSKRKIELAELAGVRLLIINEEEWFEKRYLCESMIMAKLGLCKGIGARTLTVDAASKQETDSFCEANHILGAAPSSTRYCLRDSEGAPMAVMTFARPRFTEGYDFELVRYCSLVGTSVTGGASRLLRTFLRGADWPSLVSYSNLRYSNGGLYSTLGFRRSHRSPPNYQYIKGRRVFGRLSFQKHKLRGFLEQFDENLTESENAFMNGYRRRWDAGNDVWVRDAGAD